MDLFGKLVFLVLFAYFSYRVAVSIQCLNEQRIGTTINRKR